MKSSTIHKLSGKYLPDAVSVLFILLFFYAACSKLLDFQKFQIQLGKSPVLASFWRPVAWAIPFLEIGLAILLTNKRTQLVALFTSFSLMTMFSTYIIIILNFSEYIPCSCGGILENMSWKQHFWFNAVFVALAAVAVIVYPNNKKEIIAR